MKIIVVSDTHGRIQEFLKNIKGMDKPDLIIHLGDYVEDGIKIEKAIGTKTVIVKGNGDYFSSGYDEDQILEIDNKRIFITHGHNYNVRFTIDNLYYKGKEVNADLILFGHTHESLYLEEDGIIIMNPGSASLPRGFNRNKTFGLIDIDDNIIGKIIQID